MWDDLMRALCLMLVIEGLLPVIAPARWKLTVSQLAQADTGNIRMIGLLCMILGAVALFFLQR